MEYRVTEQNEKTYIKAITHYDEQNYYYAFSNKENKNRFYVFREGKYQNRSYDGIECAKRFLDKLNADLEPIIVYD